MKEARRVNTRSLLLSVLILSSSVLQSFAHYHPDEGRWLSRDPIGEQAGPNLYLCLANMVINRIDPLGLKAWESEADKVVTDEVVKTLHDCIARKMQEYIDQQKKVDCADAALTALIECAAEAKLPLSLPVWDADKKKWAYLRSEDEAYVDIGSFIKDVTSKMGAISLWDRDKITSAEEIAKLQPGDLVIYDLRDHGGGYTGHTMVVLENDASAKKVTVGEGHMTTPVGKETYSYDEILTKWKGPVQDKGRVWNCNKCLKK